MPTTGHHLFEGHRLAYETYGEGKRAVILIHGLMMTRRMQEPLAKALAKAGNVCVTVDLVGHGESDKPLYNWDIPRYAEAIDSLVEALGFDQAVLIGTSLGANISLQVANDHPEHVRGMVIEMPALENAMIGGTLFFGPFAAIGEYAAPLARLMARGVRRLPEPLLPFGANILLDLARRDPEDTVNVLKGLFYGPLAPSQEERRAMTQPAIVIGHHFDPIHPYNDAKDLVELLPDARLIDATSIAELRLTPKRITKQVIDFVEKCWGPQVVGEKKTSAKRAAPRRRRTS
jgi:pimeloyl-ACP methyl ester carboxylesterase